jgi:hypothetical protein
MKHFLSFNNKMPCRRRFRKIIQGEKRALKVSLGSVFPFTRRNERKARLRYKTRVGK